MQTTFNWEGFGWAGRLAWWVAVSLSTLVVGLVLRRGVAPPGSWRAGRTGAWILRVLALTPILRGLVWFAAVVFGLGALVVAIWRARSASRAVPTRPLA